MDLHDIHIGYSSGTFSLQERAWAEQLYLSMCHEVQKQLDPQNRAHRPIIDELQERMADKMYVNFSLFQSMPDAWGIDQLFPVRASPARFPTCFAARAAHLLQARSAPCIRYVPRR